MLHIDDQQEDQHDEHNDASKHERPDLACHALDLPAAGPDAQPGLIGAGEMPHQITGDNRDENNQGRKPILGGRTGRAQHIAP